MKIDKMTKEELELLSNKDITNLLLEEKGCQNTADLFKMIIELLELPSSTFDNKIGDYYTSLTTDKRFIMLEDGTWDLKSRHQAVKLADLEDEDEEIEDLGVDEESDEESDDTEDFDSNVDDDDANSFDDDDDLSDLVILDEDELELEQ